MLPLEVDFGNVEDLLHVIWNVRTEGAIFLAVYQVKIIGGVPEPLDGSTVDEEFHTNLSGTMT